MRILSVKANETIRICEDDPMKFPFNEPENVAVFTCKHVVEDGADICYVSHDEEDGCWQFLCNLDSHIESEARIISLKYVFDLDHSLAQLADMPLGCGATRENRDTSWNGNKRMHD